MATRLRAEQIDFENAGEAFWRAFRDAFDRQLPPGDAVEDLVVTTTGGEVYRFAQVRDWEFIDRSLHIYDRADNTVAVFQAAHVLFVATKSVLV